MVVLSEFIQGSSSSSSAHDHYQYDVFISFRGIDTRLGFTDHLYSDLKEANLKTFLDEEDVEFGLPLKPELERAIKTSRASVIVLSKNYASSTWCLEELVLILEQQSDFNQIVIPIFYHVEPTHVRKQRSNFGDSMAKHKKRMKAEPNAEKRSQMARKMEKWEKALKDVADLKGKDVKGRKETEFIAEIVTDIHRRLGAPLTESNTLPHLIGREDKINLITWWLTDGSRHIADILTISGMSGIGKKSLANYVFRLHRHTFNKSSFVEDIKKRSKEANGLLDLQKKLYEKFSNKFDHDDFEYTCMIENALTSKKVFLVLDDVDSLDQLDALLGKNGFHPGSKIIITTEDRSLTKRYSLVNQEVQPKHTEVHLEGLDKNDSLKFLCTHAFMCKFPKEGYEEVSRKLVSYCQGHPLALKVLGESLRNRNVAYWKGCIKGLNKEPQSCVRKALKMSYESLELNNDKDLFKHIACFFVGADRDVTETILEACGIETETGITNLIERCLLSIGRYNEFKMHHLIQKMGRDVVRQESDEKPWKRSRLWCHEESFKVLKQKKGKGKILGLTLDMKMLEQKKLSESLEVETDSLRPMDRLMLLQLNYAMFNPCFEITPKELRWLCMHGFPLESVPLDLPMENLVVLDLSYSKIESFGMWYSNSQPSESRNKLIELCSKDKQLLGSLKILNLSFSKQLHSLGGFHEFRVLEKLIAKSCTSLTHVCDSIGQCFELVYIDMSCCNKFEKLPVSIGKLEKLITTLFDGCNFSQIKIWDKDSSKMNVANIGINSQTSSSDIMKTIPSDLKSWVIYLPCSLVTLSLKRNNLSNESFPDDLRSLSMLKVLHLDGNPIVSMPKFVRGLPSLETLTMEDCKMLKSIKHPPCTLQVLSFYSANRSLGRPKASLQKIEFCREMSTLRSYYGDFLESLPRSSFKIDGMVKIEPMAGVEEKVLHSLGWTNLEFIKEMCLGTYTDSGRHETSQTQLYYEFGIFSTIYEGKEMPNWISRRIMEPSISFTIPSSPKKLRGLNICFVYMYPNSYTSIDLPIIKISNITKDQTWLYRHYIGTADVGEKCLTYLSHWMIGTNEMEHGDQVTISVIELMRSQNWTTECGVGLVYDDGKTEEDVLGYYKSWNHVIGGDLCAFQLTTGEYFLESKRFERHVHQIESHYIRFFKHGVNYKERRVAFKAFSQRKADILVHTSVIPQENHAVSVEEDGFTREENIEMVTDELLEEASQQIASDNEFGIGKRRKTRKMKLKNYLLCCAPRLRSSKQGRSISFSCPGQSEMITALYR